MRSTNVIVNAKQRSSTPLKRGLWSATLHAIANPKLNAKWLAHSAFQADDIGFESRQLHQSMPSWWNQQTRYAQNVVTRVVRVQILPRVPICGRRRSR